MLLRFVFAVIAAAGVFFLVRKLRGHPLQRVPALWKYVARRNEVVRKALKIRRSMARTIIRGRAKSAEFLMGDVDRLIESLVAMVRLEIEDPDLGAETSEGSERALTWLRDAHASLDSIADMEDRLALEKIHNRLTESMEDASISLVGLQRAKADAYDDEPPPPEIPTPKVLE